MDASYKSLRRTLTLVSTDNHSPIHWSDPSFRPYYLTEKDASINSVKKIDLFTRRERSLNKVTATGTPPKERNAWEQDIDPALSYVYDKRLQFGALHGLHDNIWTPELSEDPEQSSKFPKLFSDIERHDSLKHETLRGSTIS